MTFANDRHRGRGRVAAKGQRDCPRLGGVLGGREDKPEARLVAATPGCSRTPGVAETGGLFPGGNGSKKKPLKTKSSTGLQAGEADWGAGGRVKQTVNST